MATLVICLTAKQSTVFVCVNLVFRFQPVFNCSKRSPYVTLMPLTSLLTLLTFLLMLLTSL